MSALVHLNYVSLKYVIKMLHKVYGVRSESANNEMINVLQIKIKPISISKCLQHLHHVILQMRVFKRSAAEWLRL